MRIHYKQSQFELFPERAPQTQTQKSLRWGLPISSLTLSIENIIILAILGVMILVLSYAMGVEKGKQLAVASLQKTKITSKSFSLKETEAVAAQKEDKVVPVMTRALESPSQKPKEQLKESDSPAPSPVYTIQVASFKSEKYARKEVNRIGNIGHEIFVVPKGKYSIVCIGKFNRRQEAEMLITQLKKRYKDCLIRRF